MAGSSYINTNAPTTGSQVGTLTQTATQILSYMKGARRVEPKRQALLTLLERVKNRRPPRFTAQDTTIRYFSKGTMPRALILLNAAGTGTTLEFTDASILEAGDILKFLDELMRVTAVNTGTTPHQVTVVRNSPTQSGFSSRSLAANNIIQIVSLSRPEGANASNNIYLKKTEHSNVYQIFNKSAEFSGTHLATDQYTQDDTYKEGVEDATFYCREMLERALWFHLAGGERLSASGDNAHGLMKGIPAFVTTNRFDAGGRLTYRDFNEYMMACTRYGKGSHKVVFAGPGAMSIFSEFPKTSIERKQMDKTFGMNITRLFGTGGWTCDIVPNWHYEGDEGGTIMIADLDYFHVLPMKGRSFEQMAAHDVQTPGADLRKFTVRGEYTCALEIEQTWGIIENAWR